VHDSCSCCCQAALTDENIKDAVKRWFDPETRQAVVEEFGEIGDWKVGAVTDMERLLPRVITTAHTAHKAST